MSSGTFGSDLDFGNEKMVNWCNAALANGYGNLAQRTLSMVQKNCDGLTPEHQQFTNDDQEIMNKARNILAETDEHMEVQKINKYASAIIALVREGNQYIDCQEPWKLKKTDPVRMMTVLYTLMEFLRCVSIAYQPIMPSSSAKVLDQLGVPEEERMFRHLSDEEFRIKTGTALQQPQGVFPRLEAEE